MSITNSPTEHLLLTSLGGAPGAVLALLDWLQCREHWNHADPYPDVIPITHLWVITTNGSGIVNKLHEKLFCPLNNESFRKIHRRVLTVDIEDIQSADDDKLMTEVIFRLVLQGETWRRGKADRCFSASIVGGRKTMSAAMQRATTFFEVDYLWHMACNLPKHEDSLDWIRRNLSSHHPICVSHTPTPWRRLLENPWKEQYPNRPLIAASFPLSDAWNENKESASKPWELGNPEQPYLVDCLEKIAGNTANFADRALATGVGPHFLRHDLAGIVRRWRGGAPQRDEIDSVVDYLQGLSGIIAPPATAASPVGRIAVRELPGLIEKAFWLVADAPPVPRVSEEPPAWENDQTRLTIENPGWNDCRNDHLLGLDGQTFLPVLRNLLRNALVHGAKQEERVLVRLQLERTNQGIRLLCRNRVPNATLRNEDFQKLIEEPNSLKNLLEPFRTFSTEGNCGDGLGLYTVSRTVDRAKERVQLIGPYLDGWPRTIENAPVDFVIGLEFLNEVSP